MTSLMLRYKFGGFYIDLSMEIKVSLGHYRSISNTWVDKQKLGIL